MHEPLRFGSVFSGVGLLDFGLCLAGIEHAWFCEADEWRRGILRQRWPGVPVYDDVRRDWSRVERVDGLVGGFPCKGASSAGKREGFGHPETVLWRAMAGAVGELRPRYVVVENVADILGLHDGEVWAEVLGTLAAFGYDVRWDCLPAGAVGAPHLRDRVFAIATYADEPRADAHAAAGGSRSAVGERAGATPDAERVGRGSGSGLREAEGEGGAGVGRGRSHDGGVQAAADPNASGRGERGGSVAGTPQHAAAERAGAAVADSERVAGELRGGAGGVVAAAEASAGDEPGAVGGLEPAAAGGDQARGVAVEWGQYEPAIRRWEAVHGSAPEPLVRGVDDRGAARVERSRLSALGDGVQVQVGRIVGEYVMALERARRYG